MCVCVCVCVCVHHHYHYYYHYQSKQSFWVGDLATDCKRGAGIAAYVDSTTTTFGGHWQKQLRSQWHDHIHGSRLGTSR